MKEITIRGIDFDDIGEVHEFLARELDFPWYYGKNLDALYDVLTDLPEDISIEMDLADMEDDELLDQLNRMAEVLEDASRENLHIDFQFVE